MNAKPDVKRCNRLARKLKQLVVNRKFIEINRQRVNLCDNNTINRDLCAAYSN